MSTAKYPQLEAMGIVYPLKIDRYQINSIGGSDYLRIVYKAGEGTFLPVARTYRFPRVQKTFATGGPDKTVMESNPELRQAESELKSLLASKENQKFVVDTVLEELDLLQHEVANRSAYIRELIKKL